MTIKCLIIDDEPSAQIVLKNFIGNVAFLELGGVCNNAVEAMEFLQAQTVDLLFLDINMPKISGLTLYKSLAKPPKVIFTTAYPKYAVDGFEVNAVDFLLKPFSFERFLAALNKIFDSNGRVNSISSAFNPILLKSNKTTHKVLPKDVLFIEAYGDYVKVFLKNKIIVTAGTFAGVLGLLPASTFVQVHKSFAINLEAMDSLSGNQIAIEKYSIPIGQKYKADFMNVLSNPYPIKANENGYTKRNSR